MLPPSQRVDYTLPQRRKLRRAEWGLLTAAGALLVYAGFDAAVAYGHEGDMSLQWVAAWASAAGCAGLATCAYALARLPRNPSRLLLAAGTFLFMASLVPALFLQRLGGLAIVPAETVDFTAIGRVAGALILFVGALVWLLFPARPRWKVDLVRFGALMVALAFLVWLIQFLSILDQLADFLEGGIIALIIGLRAAIILGFGGFAFYLEAPTQGSAAQRPPPPPRPPTPATPPRTATPGPRPGPTGPAR